MIGAEFLERWRSLTVRRAVGNAVMVAAAVRAWCSVGVPLTITNDGNWYLMAARRILAHEAVVWPPIRTPGYPLFLAGIFEVFGVGPAAVLIVQHALGCVTVGLIAAMAARFAGPRWGLVLGVLAALDPAALGLECYALSETLATALLVVCAAIVARARQRGWWVGIGLGVAIGALCLVRPAFELMAPFLVAAWAWPRREDRVAAAGGEAGRWGKRSAAVVAGCLAVTGPWLIHNARNGVVGLSSSNGTLVWMGVCEAGLLSDDFALPDRVRAEYTRLVRPKPDDDERVHRFVARVDGWSDGPTRTLLKRWAWYSIWRSPGAYAGMAVRAAGWQLELFPSWWPAREDELRWMMRRLSEDGRALGQPLSNVNISGRPEGLEVFAMPAGHGMWARYLRWWSGRSWIGLPRLGLCAASILAVVAAARRREWGVALLLMGTLVYFGAHAACLMWPSRYSLPVWEVWWVAPAVVWGMRGWGGGPAEVRAPAPA